MTSLAQVTALVDAHVRRDHARFRAVALQIAAHVSGRSEQGAEKLRKLVDTSQAIPFLPIAGMQGLLAAIPIVASLDDMILAPVVRERLDRVVREQVQRDELLSQDLQPARKLLFTGSPGVGKTMAAGAIASVLGMPLLRVELHGVISSYLGETAAKLAKVFEHVRSMPAVYLFDEVDALGAERSEQTQGASSAEMRRVVNSLLQFVEDDRSASLIIAATNHDQMLDNALFRRFDEVIEFRAPRATEVLALVQRKLGTVEGLDTRAICAAVEKQGLGHADICVALDRVRKDHVIEKTVIDTFTVIASLQQRGRSS
jgi:SpoVK/Ycf46/Vps4 family AAA+-type ATPase